MSIVAEIKEPSILFILSRTYKPGMGAEALYEITRKSWALGKTTTKEKAQYAFAVYKGEILQVYKIDRWYPVTTKNPEQAIRDRWAFDGHVATNLKHYLGQRLPEALKTYGPYRYVNC